MAEFRIRRVVDGLVYDTTTADEIATHRSGARRGGSGCESRGGNRRSLPASALD